MGYEAAEITSWMPSVCVAVPFMMRTLHTRVLAVYTKCTLWCISAQSTFFTGKRAFLRSKGFFQAKPV